MRDIKFRLFDGEKMNYNVIGYDYNCGGVNRELLAVFNEEKGCVDYYKVDEELDLMQYTGMKDVNGKEIYEDDIVKVSECMAGEDFIGKVIYDELEGCYFIIRGSERSYCKITIDLEDYSHYVIGNIYDNSELLDN